MPAPTVFIVDDDPSLLKSLERLISAAGYATEAFCSAREFLSKHRSDEPACMVLDMQMPELDGFELQQQLNAETRQLPVIFLTGYGDIPQSVKAIKAGAVDFLTKPCLEADLLAAIGSALAKDEAARRERVETVKVTQRIEMLTPREREVLSHVIAGRLNKQIAYDLGLCEQTVKVHRMRITEKLQARSLLELARIAQKAGVMPSAS